MLKDSLLTQMALLYILKGLCLYEMLFCVYPTWIYIPIDMRELNQY